MGSFFVRPEEPNLAVFREELDRLLEVYSSATEGRIGFGDFRGFEYTPDKGYTGRAIVPTQCDSERIEDLYVLLFKPGDGTGDESTYRLAEINSEHAIDRCIIPRRKRCQTEAWLSLGTASPYSFVSGAVYLDLLTVDNSSAGKPRELRCYGQVGTDRDELWCEMVNKSKSQKPYAGFTVGYRGSEMTRFGDPHAVYFRKKDQILPASQGKFPDVPVIQMAGFIELGLGTPAHKVFQELSINLRENC